MAQPAPNPRRSQVWGGLALAWLLALAHCASDNDDLANTAASINTCAKAGEAPSTGKAPGPGPCCPGLTQTLRRTEHQGQCMPSVADDLVCLPCGNGVCDPGESACLCPHDCS